MNDDVTVLVFKDNYSARTFQVPLGWISRFGFLLGILAGVALLSTFFAIKFYRVTRHLDPTRIQDLEQELTDLKSKAAALPAPAPAPAPVLTPAPVAAAPAAPLPVPTVTVTVTAAPPPAPAQPQAQPQPAGAALVFGALPESIRPWPAGTKLPIQINAAKAAWVGKTLKIHFNIEYVNEDQGSQQGRILILARGAETILAYPDGALNPAASGALLAPEKGEYFSVSRFREVNAEFGPLRSAKSIREAEIILLSHDGKLLIHQTLSPESAPQEAVKPAAPAKPRAKPATPSTSPAKPDSELIEPGVDQ